MSDPMSYVNPEPPAELIEIKQDLIGDTLFSKHWLCEFLLKLIKKIDSDEELMDEAATASEDSCSTASPVESKFKELDAEFEKELCDLWDMSVEKDVCAVLDELNSIQIFEGYLRKFDQVYPRAAEILIGILVNMVSLCDTIGLELVANKPFIQYLLFDVFSSMSDVPTVIQSIRLFTLFLNDECQSEDESKTTRRKIKKSFVEYLKNELDEDESEDRDAAYSPNWQGIIEKFYFILEQSLNPLLLDCSIQLLLSILDSDDQILESLTMSERIVDAICSSTMTRIKLDRTQKKTVSEAQFTESSRRDAATSLTYNRPDQTPNLLPSLTSQLSEEDVPQIDHLFNKYFLCLQTISTCENGVKSLVVKFNSIVELFVEYLEKCLCTFNDWEMRSANSIKTSISQESLQNLLCILSVLNCVFANQTENFCAHMEKSKPVFLLQLLTFSRYYLRLFPVLSQNETQQSINLEMVKNNFHELFQNLRNVSESKIKRLCVECVRILENIK